MTFPDAFSWIKIAIKISLKFGILGPINNELALFQMMAWNQAGDKPLPKPMMSQFTHAKMCHSALMS